MKAYLQTFSDKLFELLESKKFLALTVGWFIVQVIFIAKYTNFGIGPDESYHLELTQLFKENLHPFINDSVQNKFMEIRYSPFIIYHYLLSLFEYISSNLFFLRLLNGLLGLISIFFTAKIADSLKVKPIVKNISIFMLVNTIMFTFLAASINYDNLFVAFVLSSSYFLLCYIKDRSWQNLLLTLTLCFAGLLTKENFIAHAAAIGVVLAFTVIKTRGPLFKNKLQLSDKKYLFLFGIFILVGGFMIQRYAYNYLEFGSYKPECTQIQTIDECREIPVFERNERVYGVDAKEADRDVAEYSVSWYEIMLDRTYGVFGHKTYDSNKYSYLYMFLYFIVGSFFAIRYLKPNRYQNTVLFIIIVNLAVLLMYNFNVYANSGRLGFIVHGRYMFGVLPLIYLVLNNAFVNFLKKPWAKTLYLLSVLLVFAISFPYHILVTWPEWYR